MNHTDRNGNVIGGRTVSSAIREAWSLRYELTDKKRYLITESFCNQLSCCKTDEARRLILGVSA